MATNGNPQKFTDSSVLVDLWFSEQRHSCRYDKVLKPVLKCGRHLDINGIFQICYLNFYDNVFLIDINMGTLCNVHLELNSDIMVDVNFFLKYQFWDIQLTFQLTQKMDSELIQVSK